MKVRWMANSLRLRITPTELSELVEGRCLRQRLGPKGSWEVSVLRKDESSLTFAGETLEFAVGKEDILILAHPSREGVYLTSEDQPPVVYFIEKDFPCLHERPPETREPASETFAPPLGFKERHRSRAG